MKRVVEVDNKIHQCMKVLLISLLIILILTSCNPKNYSFVSTDKIEGWAESNDFEILGLEKISENKQSSTFCLFSKAKIILEAILYII